MLCRCACKAFDGDFVLSFPAAITTTLVRFTQTAATFFVFVHFPHAELLSATMSQVAWRSVGGSKVASL
jgi:hypothetical protein